MVCEKANRVKSSDYIVKNIIAQQITRKRILSLSNWICPKARGAWSFSCKILYLDKFFLPVTTPKSNPSKHHKHFRKAVAFRFRKLELGRHYAVLGRVIFRTFATDSGFRTYAMLTAMIILPYMQQLRLPALNETHTSIYTSPRLWKYNKLIFDY
jgi:hypothetical protein